MSQTYIELPPINGANCEGSNFMSCAPPGFSNYFGSPDIIPGNITSGFITTVNVNGSSTSGGSMARFLSVNLRNTRDGFWESFQTVLTGLTAGESYSVAVEWQQVNARTGVNFSGGSLRMWALNSGEPQNYTSSGATDTWQLATYTFTATATTEPIVLGVLATGSPSSIVIDSGNLSSFFTCAIDDPGFVSATCISPNNDLQFSLNLTGSNIGSTYTVSGAIPTTGTYGTSTTFTIASGADGTDKMIAVTDDTDTSCSRDITITGVAACFSCDSGADGPRFLGLTKSTWMLIGLVSGLAALSGVFVKRFVL